MIIPRTTHDRLADRMRRLGITESDFEEHFIRSGGKGGQHTNKVATCVYLRHLPTGLEVKCEAERSQAANRQLARWWIVEKIEQRRLDAEASRRSQREKSLRQKRGLSPLAKRKRLDEKHKRSELKQGRAFRPEGSED